ncbi:MAG: hypothetical protein ACUVX8_14145 [Candidatus Zipacnadales bacterium]
MPRKRKMEESLVLVLPGHRIGAGNVRNRLSTEIADVCNQARIVPLICGASEKLGFLTLLQLIKRRSTVGSIIWTEFTREQWEQIKGLSARTARPPRPILAVNVHLELDFQHYFGVMWMPHEEPMREIIAFLTDSQGTVQMPNERVFFVPGPDGEAGSEKNIDAVNCRESFFKYMALKRPHVPPNKLREEHLIDYRPRGWGERAARAAAEVVLKRFGDEWRKAHARGQKRIHPAAIVTINDVIGLHIRDEIRNNLPDQPIKIVGWDGSPRALETKLATVVFDVAAAARELYRVWADQLRKPCVERVRPELVDLPLTQLRFEPGELA